MHTALQFVKHYGHLTLTMALIVFVDLFVFLDLQVEDIFQLYVVTIENFYSP